MVASVLLRIRIPIAATLLLTILAAKGNMASAQSSDSDSQKAEAGDLVIHQNVRRVVVDVVVSDSTGKPVPGLNASDFSVAEDGKSQRIRSFDVHDFDSIADSLPKHPTSLPKNTFVNVPSGPERGPLYVLLLDLLNMEVDDQPAAREQLLKFARSKPLGTRFAVFVLSDGLYLLQGFTEDRNQLADVVDPKDSRPHLPKIFLYADNYRPAISIPRVLMTIANFLADLPGHKNVIWISASFPSSIMPSADPSVEAANMSDEIKEATDTLARGQIAVYPVDVRGVAVTGATAANSGRAGDFAAGNSAEYAVNARHMTEDEIANATGGRAFYGTNDVAEALTEATETGAHYYTLSYSPSNQTYNGRMRHIHVDLANRGYHLAYRRSYFGNPSSAESDPKPELRSASEQEKVRAQRPADSLSPNMQHGAPLAHQLLFRAHIHALAPPAKATPEQMASLADQPAYFNERRQKRRGKPPRPIELQTFEIDYTVAARYPSLELAAAAFDADGKMLNGIVQMAEETEEDDGERILASARHGAIYRLQQQFDVPITAVSVRLAVRDVATDNVGALEINLPLAPEGKTTDAQAHSAAPPADPIDSAKPR